MKNSGWRKLGKKQRWRKGSAGFKCECENATRKPLHLFANLKVKSK